MTVCSGPPACEAVESPAPTPPTAPAPLPPQVFTLYNRSHLYYAFELLSMLTTLYLVKGCAECNYGSITWSGWLLAFVLIFAPLWFNPFSFDIAKVKTNFLAWQRWMHGDVDPLTGSNWYTWNK